jgi:Tol biopolymer transport system component
MRWLTASTLALAVLFAAPAAHGTFPGRNGRIAFTSYEYSAEDNSYVSWIVSMRPDGSEARLLARGRPEDAVYRPDGHMMAFVRPLAGIFLMRSDGSAKRRLLAGPYREPDWAPDGRRLVVARTRRPRGLVIWDRGGVRALTLGSSSAPAWSPTGTQIAFTAPDPRTGASTVYVVSSSGCCPRRLALGDEPEWSPNGRRILFTRGGNVMRSIRADGTGFRRLAPVHGSNPVPSPDGKRVAYVKKLDYSGFRADAVFMMGADGRRRTRVFNTVGALNIGIYASRLDWQPR